MGMGLCGCICTKKTIFNGIFIISAGTLEILYVWNTACIIIKILYAPGIIIIGSTHTYDCLYALYNIMCIPR